MNTNSHSSTESKNRYVAICPECDVTYQTDTPNEIIEFHRRHGRVTGHSVVFESAQLDVNKQVTETNVKNLVSELEDDHKNGVPIGIIAAVLNEQAISIDDTLDKIHEARMTGGMYEPRDDHLSTF